MAARLKIVRSMAFVLLTGGCSDHGLEPAPPIDPGFGGIIYYARWPPLDSLKDLRLVAFKDFPPTNIVGDVLSGRAYVFPRIGEPHLPFYVDSTAYEFHVPSGRYAYVAVAQQFGDSLFKDWRAVGQYDLDTIAATPSPLEVGDNTFIPGVNIVVDFRNPPPTPIVP